MLSLEVREEGKWCEGYGVVGRGVGAVGVVADEGGPLVGVFDEARASGVREEVDGEGEECGVIGDEVGVIAVGEDGAATLTECVDESGEARLEVAHKLGEVEVWSAEDEMEVVGEEDKGEDLDLVFVLRIGEEFKDEL